ncbi:MAG: hypothetical protein JJU06_16500 [Ectothiorhodospiraceae bacterium]|nr:hypothetical protein [Ectothiorhodospiraceae bacterium]MCH8505115.1 hypothetical protein [Ectothiorhodospiraceae bacterium]
MMQDWNAWWHGSAIAIRLDLSPSRTARSLSFFLCALTVAALIAASAQGLLAWWFLPLAFVALLLELRRQFSVQPQTLLIFPIKQKIETGFSGDSEMLCLYDWWVHPLLVAIWVRPADGGRRSRVLLIWHDSIPEPVHRALRRWLRQLAYQGSTGSV